MKLDLILPTRILTLNNKEIRVPKLGLKHHRLVKEIKSLDEHLRVLIESIHPGLDGAEMEFVLVHIGAFNGRCKDQKTVDNFTYDIKTMRIDRETTFELDKTYKFRSPYLGETFNSAKDILESTKTDDTYYGSMPAFVVHWADKIASTVSIEGPNGRIEGCAKIMEILA